MIPHDQISRTKQVEQLRYWDDPVPIDTTWVKVKRLKCNGVIPSRGRDGDAGLDLHSTESLTIDPGDRALISTGIALAIPTGFAGLIWPRSGLSVKNGIDVLAGVVDSNYRGEIKVCLQNHSKDYCFISAGDRIAQILIQKIATVEMIQVSHLDSTDRNGDGFGSSGN